MLKIEALHAGYRGIKALRGLSLQVAVGEMVALIGSNGAGKSTLLNCISGIVPPVSGRMLFDGANLVRLPAWRVARMGLLQVPEGRQVLAAMSVLENLHIGRSALRGRAATYTLRDVYDLFPILEKRSSQLAGSLSGGQQQMLAIGRALMGAPRMLLLDEPGLGLAPLVVKQVFAALQQVSRDGLTILLVEQNARMALGATDRAYVLDQGLIVHEGSSKALSEDHRVIDHYLGNDPVAA